MYLVGLNFSNKVIIITDAGRFEGVKDRKHASIIGILLDIVFNIIDLQGR